MAQWKGQYTGRTHESKVKEIEVTFVNAIRSCRDSDESSKTQKRRDVLKLSEKLLRARCKALKARISELSVPSEEHSNKLQALKKSLEILEEGGLNSIMTEFEILDLAGNE